jgi:hypothetical protein
MTDIIVKIMVEFLSVLGLATKQIKQGRFSECAITYMLSMAQCIIEKIAKKLLGKKGVEAVLQKLDRLNQDEARMTVARTLDIVHGFVDNMQVAMEGTSVCMFITLRFSEHSLHEMARRSQIVFDSLLGVSRAIGITCSYLAFWSPSTGF